MRSIFHMIFFLVIACPQSVSAQEMKPKSVFTDCENCPQMVVIPPGQFLMGASKQDAAIPHTQHNIPSERPRHKVTFNYHFAIGKTTVTVQEFDHFIKSTGTKTGGKCGIRLADYGPQKHKYTGKRHRASKNLYSKNFVFLADGTYATPGLKVTPTQPAVCISRSEAKAYLNWLGKKSGRKYRLPTEAEWEYAARAGTKTPFFWGTQRKQACDYANFADKKSVYMGRRAAKCSDKFKSLWAAPVASYKPNDFGLYDMAGNVQEMLEDCWHKSYKGAPTDGSPWMDSKKCAYYIARGGDYELPVSAMRSAERLFYGSETDPHDRYNVLGFRAALSLDETAWDKK